MLLVPLTPDIPATVIPVEFQRSIGLRPIILLFVFFIVLGWIKNNSSNVATMISSKRIVRTNIIFHFLVHLFQKDHTISLLIKKKISIDIHFLFLVIRIFFYLFINIVHWISPCILDLWLNLSKIIWNIKTTNPNFVLTIICNTCYL